MLAPVDVFLCVRGNECAYDIKYLFNFRSYFHKNNNKNDFMPPTPDFSPIFFSIIRREAKKYSFNDRGKNPHTVTIWTDTKQCRNYSYLSYKFELFAGRLVSGYIFVCVCVCWMVAVFGIPSNLRFSFGIWITCSLLFLALLCDVHRRRFFPSSAYPICCCGANFAYFFIRCVCYSFAVFSGNYISI